MGIDDLPDLPRESSSAEDLGATGLLSFAQDLLVPLAEVVFRRIAHPPEVALSPVASPVVGIVPVALKRMGRKKGFVIGAGFQSEILLAANAAVGHLFIPFCAGKTCNRREGSAVGTAHDELQYAVA